LKVLITIFQILFLSLNGLTQDSTSWVQIDLDGATIELPPSFTHKRLRGIDSQVGEFRCDSIIIRYDYGGFGMSNSNDSCNLAQEELDQLEMFQKDWFKKLYSVPELSKVWFITINGNPGNIVETKATIGQIRVSVSKCNSDLYFGIKSKDLSFEERQLVVKIGTTIKFE
jgi:hypothetical protein